jgi:hypothetical protein
MAHLLSDLLVLSIRQRPTDRLSSLTIGSDSKIGAHFVDVRRGPSSDPKSRPGAEKRSFDSRSSLFGVSYARHDLEVRMLQQLPYDPAPGVAGVQICK